MHYIPERTKVRDRIDSIYHSPNGPKPHPLKVAEELKKLYEKASKDPRWLELWLENHYVVEEHGDPGRLVNFQIDLMGERWQTDEEYLRVCQHVQARGDYDLKQHMQMQDKIDAFQEAKVKLEGHIKGLEVQIEESKRNDKRRRREEQIAKLTAERDAEEES